MISMQIVLNFQSQLRQESDSCIPNFFLSKRLFAHLQLFITNINLLKLSDDVLYSSSSKKGHQ